MKQTITLDQLRQDTPTPSTIALTSLLDQSRTNSVFTQKDGEHETVALRDHDGEYFTVKRIRD